MVWTLGWTWLPFQGLPRFPCLGTVGLSTCWLGLLPCQLCYRAVLPPQVRIEKPTLSAPWEAFNTGLVSTLVWPNLYWVWSTSMDPRSISEAFLLSMNCPSGIALALSTLYLQKKTEHEEIPITTTVTMIEHHSLLKLSRWISLLPGDSSYFQNRIQRVFLLLTLSARASWCQQCHIIMNWWRNISVLLFSTNLKYGVSSILWYPGSSAWSELGERWSTFTFA